MVTARQDVFLSGGQDAIVTPARVISTAAVPAPTVSTSNQSAAYPKYVSTHPTNGESTVQTWRRNLGYGFTGIVNYRNTSQPTSWDSNMAALATTHGNQPLTMQLTCKAHSDSGLQSVLASMPDAWRPGFRYNFWQEPQNGDFPTAADKQRYRDTYAAAAAVIRTWNTANPTRTVQMPWLELTEFSLELKYDNGDLSQDPVPFKPASEADYDGVLWSLFDYNDNGPGTYTPTVAKVAAKVAHITRCMSETFPGKPWALMAGAFTLEKVSDTDDQSVDTFTSTQKANQAFWLTEMHNQTKAAGSTGWAWYSRKFLGAPDPNNPGFSKSASGVGESRVEVIPETFTAFQNLPL